MAIAPAYAVLLLVHSLSAVVTPGMVNSIGIKHRAAVRVSSGLAFVTAISVTRRARYAACLHPAPQNFASVREGTNGRSHHWQQRWPDGRNTTTALGKGAGWMQLPNRSRPRRNVISAA